METLDARWGLPGGMPGEMARTETLGGGPGSIAPGDRRCEYALWAAGACGCIVVLLISLF